MCGPGRRGVRGQPRLQRYAEGEINCDGSSRGNVDSGRNGPRRVSGVASSYSKWPTRSTASTLMYLPAALLVSQVIFMVCEPAVSIPVVHTSC